MKLLPDHPHARFLLEASRPGRYAGSEWGCAPVPARPALRLALAFPDVYEIGCSNLGILVLYRIAQRLGDVQVERAFAPWDDYARLLAREGRALLSYESGIPLGAFDLLGFSLQHELLATNVLSMLSLARIPLRSRDRGAGDPLVIAGGPSAANGEPLAPFVDAFAPGDGEEVLAAIVGVVRRAKARGAPREEALEELASLEGVYVPSRYERADAGGGRLAVTGVVPGSGARLPVRASLFGGFARSPVEDPIVAAVEPVFDRFQVEITRGCSGGCRFCAAGTVYRPVRDRGARDAALAAVDGLARTGYGTLSVSSLSPADYPGLDALFASLEGFVRRERVQVGVSSLRAYGVSERVLACIASVKATGITLAPEAGTGRLRDAIGKQVTEEDLLGSIELLLRFGWQKAKLYFMMGLPGEDDGDLEGIVRLVRACLAAARGRRRFELAVAISNFVPKPFTPFQWAPMIGPGELARKRELLRSMARGVRAKVDFHDARQSVVEAILARGGAELGPAVERAFRSGCAMDGWSDRFDFPAWEAALAAEGIDAARCLEAIPPEAPLPWGHVRFPVEPGFLREELDRARRGEALARCASPDTARGCNACGAPCDEVAQGAVEDAASLRAAVEERAAGWRAAGDRLFGGELPPGERLFLGMRFRRFGRAIWSGHQDVIRIMLHMLRRAGIPMRYSEGFTPRPHLQFRCALPIGVVGIGEQAFVELARAPRDEAAVAGELNARAHPGFAFLEARAMPRGDVRRLLASTPAIRWSVLFDEETGAEGIERAARGIVGAASIPSRRGDAETDLRRMVTGARAAAPAGVEELSGCACLEIDSEPVGGHLLRTEEIAFMLAPYGLTPRWYIRDLVD